MRPTSSRPSSILQPTLQGSQYNAEARPVASGPPQAGVARKRRGRGRAKARVGALLGNSNAGWHWNELVFGGALVVGTVGEIPSQHAPVLVALVQVHIHDLEGHVLCARVPHQRRSLQIPQPNLQPQLHPCAGGQVPAEGGNSARQTGGFYQHRTTPFLGCSDCPDPPSPSHAGGPALAHTLLRAKK